MTKVDLNFVEGLTLEERADLVSGTDFWFTAKVSGMDPMLMTDGPSGLRKQVNVHSAMDQSIEAVCFPCSALTASSFDDQMLENWANSWERLPVLKNRRAAGAWGQHQAQSISRP